MFEKTHMSYGVNEVLLASVLGSVVFAVLAAQPLVIVGVTGEQPCAVIIALHICVTGREANRYCKGRLRCLIILCMISWRLVELTIWRSCAG